VEKFAGISGNKDGLDTLPDGEFLPPHDLNCVEKYFKEQVSKTIKTVISLLVVRRILPKHNQFTCNKVVRSVSIVRFVKEVVHLEDILVVTPQQFLGQ
jgi:hypothetical protein